MKKVIFAFLLVFGFMSFTTTGMTTEPIIEAPATEIVEDDAIPCCVRDCVYINGVKYCTEWECGECIIVIY